jgi:hypothetical protein
MNEELQKALSDLLGKANDGIGAASDFLVAELPDVIQQLLMWHGVYNFSLLVFSLFIAVIWFVIHKKANYKIWEWQVDSCEPVFYLFFWNAVPFFTILNTFNIEWLQIYIAPKVWLLEYTASLTKQF